MAYYVIWLVVVFLLTIVEIATINLVSIWFVISGILALIVSLFTTNFYIQFGVFVVAGIILLLLTKPVLVKLSNAKEEKLNLERIPGMEGIVTEEIKKGRIGAVKVDGKLWSATADEDILVDNLIKVIKIDGIKLVVKNIEPEKVEKKEIAKTDLPKKKSTKKNTKKSNVNNKTVKKNTKQKKES